MVLKLGPDQHNPGSFNEFVEGKTFTDTNAAVAEYFKQLHLYRVMLADSLGISIEDLRDIQSK